MRKKITLFVLSGLTIASFFFITCSKSNNSPVYTTNCADSLIGVYNGADYCSASNQPSYTSSINAATPTNITFSVMGGAVNVTAVLDCSKNSISIPAQTFPNNISISGTGTYTANRIIINWSGLSYGVPVNCNTTFTR